MVRASLQQLSGTQKSAILLLSFGEEISTEIFKNLNDLEIKRIGSAMSRLNRLDENLVDGVIAEFYSVIQRHQEFIYGDSDYTKRVTLQNIYNDGGFSSVGVSQEIIDKLNS